MLERGKVLVGYHMGLGKTVITIAAIEELWEREEVDGGFVIVPASLKFQWKRMIERFTDHDSVIVIDGDRGKRMRQYRMCNRYRYVIMNYEQVLNDWEVIRKLPFEYVVCDEVTAIKSFKAKRSRKVKRLQAPYLFGLTGQPVENKAEELFSIMEWIDRDVLGRFDIFDRAFIKRNGFGGVQYYRNLPRLHKLVSEVMVRKTIHDPEVRDQMPKVVESNVYIDFDPAGALLYRRMARALLNEIADAISKFGAGFNLWQHYNPTAVSGADKARGKIMSKLLCMRMLCDHPELLRISANRFKDGQEGVAGVTGGSTYAYKLFEEGHLGISKAPKLEEVKKTITDILDSDRRNKVVLFSFFKPTLHILQRELKYRSVLFMGGMSAQEKDKAKMQFEDDPRTRLFLSSDAGGYGLDLPSANYLINYDLPWSTGKLEQRNARIIRLSSSWGSVTVLNMLMKGSIEERQYDSLLQKKKVASAILDGRGADTKGRVVLDLKTLSDFLRTSSV